MKDKFFIGMVLVMATSLLSACGIPQGDYNDLVAERDAILAERDAALAERDTALVERDTIQDQLASLQSDYEVMQNKNKSPETDLGESKIQEYEDQIEYLNSQLSGLRSDLSRSRKQLSAMQDIKVTRHYGFWFWGQTWNWDLTIPVAVYSSYLDKARPGSISAIADMVKDSGDNPYIDHVVQQIEDAAVEKGYGGDENQKVYCVAAFVQDLPGNASEVDLPYDSYPRYPLETLFDGGGDSQDTSILVAALLNKMDYDVILILQEGIKHMMVGVSVEDTFRWHYEHNDKKYYILETTGEGWRIGDWPFEGVSITELTAHLIPIEN